MLQFVLNKKPIIFIIGFLFFIPFCNAQKLDEVQKLLNQNDLISAKEWIDKFILKNDKDAKAWLLKANIYNAISKDASTKNVLPDGKMDAFDALQNAIQISKDTISNQLKNTNYQLPFDLYNGFLNEASNFFNAAVENNDKNNYIQALNKFKTAAFVGNFIFINNWGLPPIDTCNLLNTAKAAIGAYKEEDALFYCKKIAEANIFKSQYCNGFEHIYKWLLVFYKTKKQETEFINCAAKATTNFPTHTYFILITIDWLRDKKDYKNLFANYKLLFSKYQNQNTYQLNYCNDIFNYLYQSNNTITNRLYMVNELEQGLKNYLNLNPTSNEIKLLLGKFYFNQANDMMRQAQLVSSINTQILNRYKNNEINFLKKSNKYLKLIDAKNDRNCYVQSLNLIHVNNIFIYSLQTKK